MTQETKPMQDHFKDFDKFSEFCHGLCAADTGLQQRAGQSEILVHLVHGAIGMVGEAIELLIVNSRMISNLADRIDYQTNFIEECGDLLHYTSYVLRDQPFGIDECILDAGMTDDEYHFDKRWTTDIHKSLVIRCGEVLDLAKKCWVYDKPVCDAQFEIKKAIGHVCVDVMLLCERYSTTIQMCMEANERKLRTRYPQGFSTEKALNRDLAAENMALEG